MSPGPYKVSLSGESPHSPVAVQPMRVDAVRAPSLRKVAVTLNGRPRATTAGVTASTTLDAAEAATVIGTLTCGSADATSPVNLQPMKTRIERAREKGRCQGGKLWSEFVGAECQLVTAHTKRKTYVRQSQRRAPGGPE